MSQNIKISQNDKNLVLSSSGDTIPSYLNGGVSGETGNIVLTVQDIGGGDTIVKINTGDNIFNKSLDTTDDIPSGTTKFFLDINQKDAADNSNNPSALKPFLTDNDIDDSATGSTDLWSASKVITELNIKLDSSVFEEQNLVQKECTGYPNRVDSIMSFDDGTRTFTIQPSGSSFDYWTQGTKHTVASPKTLILPAVTAKYFIFFDDLEVLGYSTSFDDSLLNDKVFTATLYWNNDSGKGEFFVDERHGLTMDWATHFHLHNAFGTRYYGGFGLGYPDLLADGSDDSHAQISMGGGRIADEDIVTTIIDSATPSANFEQVLSPIAQIPVIYKLDSGVWYKEVATDFPIISSGGTMYYNEASGSTDILTGITDGYHIAVWLIATPELNTPIVARIGTREDATLEDAKNNNNYGTIEWGDLPSQEYKVLYRLIFQYSSSYTNSVNAALRDVLDIRGSIDSTLSSDLANPSTDHGNLIGLSDDDHLQYHTDTRGDIRYYTKSQSNVNYEPKNSNIQAHISDTGNPHSVTKTQVGLSNVPNTDATLRSNHTGTQLASTISDIQTTITNNTAVAANTTKVTNATHTGDVTGSGALTIATNVVTNDKLAQVATATFKGRTTVGTGNSEDLTVTQAKTLLGISGLVSFDNYVIVKTKADLPTPAAGIITLAANTYYAINGSIALGTDRLVTGGDVKIEGLNAFTDNFIYTGVGNALFTSTDHNVSITNITFVASGVGSQVFNCSNVGKTENFIIQNSVISSSTKVGTFSGYLNFLSNIINSMGNSDGFTFSAMGNLFLLNINCSLLSVGTQIKLTTGTFNRIVLRNCVFDVDTGSTGLDIDAGVITVTNNCSIIGCSFSGGGTLTNNFASNSSNYVVKSNVGLSNFSAKANMGMINNSTQTTNVPSTTWRKIAGTTTLTNESRFTMPVDNRLTYIGHETLNFKVSVSLAAYYTSGAGRIAEIALYKNGALIAGSQNGFTIYSADEPCSTQVEVGLTTNDYIEVFFQKFGGLVGDDYVFSYLNVQINEIS